MPVDQLWWPWVTTAEDTILDLAEIVDVDESFALLVGRPTPTDH